MKFIQILRERRFFQFIGGYAAAGWLVLEAVGEFTERGLIPEIIYPLVLTFFLFGFPATIVVAWFHGAKGAQEMPSAERWLLSGIASIALITAGLAARQHLASQGPSNPFAALSPTEDPRRVAVTYFDGRGGDEADLLAEGLTESLIDELGEVEALHVISRNGVAPFQGSRATPDSIGRALEVGSIVQGRVTQADSLVRINVELVSGADGAQLASARLERPRSELFELQEELAQEVAFFLQRRVGEEVALIEERGRAGNTDAWVLLRRADELREEADRLGELGDAALASRRLGEADSLLAEAASVAPRWAEPLTDRGWVAYRMSRLRGFDRSQENSEIIARAESLAQRALGLASSGRDSAAALELRGMARYYRHLLNLTDEPGENERLLVQAESDFRAAGVTDPRQASALATLTHLLFRTGEMAEAKVAAERAYRADPYLRNANQTLWRLFWASMNLADAVEARKWCETGKRRFPDYFRFRECQVWLYTLEGADPDIDRAWELCDEVVELAPASDRAFHEHRCQVVVGMAIARATRSQGSSAGLADSARAVLRRARVGPDIDPVRELAQLEAIARTWLGDEDEAVSLLAEYYAANPHEAGSHGDHETWWLEGLRDNPRYRALVGGP